MDASGWLGRSGQLWKRDLASQSTGIAVLVFAASIAIKNAIGAVFAVVAAIAALAGCVLPMLIRCRVCGLQMETCDEARGLSTKERTEWLRSLEECPCCGDDGSASAEAQLLWSQSGQAGRRPYWSPRRILIALVVLGLPSIAPLVYYNYIEAHPLALY